MTLTFTQLHPFITLYQLWSCSLHSFELWMLFFIFSSLCSPLQLSSPIYTYNDGHKPWRLFSNFCYPSFQLPDGHLQLTVLTASQSQHVQSQIHLYQQNKLVFCFYGFLKDTTTPPSTPLSKAWRGGKKTNPNRMAGTTLGYFLSHLASFNPHNRQGGSV